MIKKLLAIMAMLYAAACFAAVDVNKATAAELDSIKGIGPGTSSRILDERKKGAFKNWSDFIERVKGVGDGNAAKYSAEGMTVNGEAFKGAVPAAKKDTKKVEAKVAAPASAPAAADAKAAKSTAKAESAKPTASTPKK